MTALILCIAITALDLQPPPQHLVLDEKRVFEVRANTPVIVAEPDRADVQIALSALFAALQFELPVQPASDTKGREPAILVGEIGAHPAFEERAHRRALSNLPTHSPEGYLLRIAQDGVLLAANTPQGTFRGVVTLTQIARQSGDRWPCVEIRDQPALAIRGALFNRAPSETDLDGLAVLGCNLVVFDCEGFQHLDADRSVPWKDVFAQARARHMEPVPSFHLFHDAQRLIARDPRAAEARTASEKLVLSGYDPVFLKEARPVITQGAKASVTISGIPCDADRDYELSSYADNGTGLWALRRLPGSRIPDGATVEIHYALVPEGSDAVCPCAKETATVLRDALGRLIYELAPNYLYVGPDRVSRLNEDFRCAVPPRSDTEILSEGLRLIDGLARAERPNLRLLVSGRAGLADGTPLPWPPDRLPEGSLVVSYPTSGAETRAPLFGVVGSADQAYRLAQHATELAALGLVVQGNEPSRLEAALLRAWNPYAPVLAWPQGLNEHFGASLWKPSFQERLDALVAYVNREIRGGSTPRELRSAYDAVHGRLLRPVASDPELETTRVLFETILDYLELEAAYRQDANTGVPARLVSLVERYAVLDPRVDDERRDHIVQTIEKEHLFVPASILFGASLDYYRPMAPPGPGVSLLPLRIQPEFRDSPFRTEAVLALDGFPLPIVRINFETVASDAILLETSPDGVHYSLHQSWTAPSPLGIHGPVLPDSLRGHPYVRLVAESKNQTAVLREVELLAPKPPATVRCLFRDDSASRLRTAMREPQWPDEASAAGFVREDGTAFAEASTTIRAAHSDRDLYFQIVAYEPRMHALVASMDRRDAALWEEESIEIRILAPDRTPFRFAFNPIGTQYDARRGDAAWNGAWSVESRTESRAWTAFVTLPREIFGESGEFRGVWGVDFIRNRRNADSERTHWTVQAGEDQPPTYGELVFE